MGTRDSRRVVMRRSMTLGHCICNPRQSCPCEELKVHGVCHCAGEMREQGNNGEGSTPVRLTEHVRNPGCASKINKALLHKVLEGLPEVDDPRVLVGASCGDDAGVIVLSDAGDNGHGGGGGGPGGKGGGLATILTVDVFAPVVDDPYTFGQIAAANSLSDIYAMGGVPQVALSIVGWPAETLPAEALREMLRGGADKMKEAGVPVIGGHSINDQEVKCGFAVVGSCRGGRFVRNAGARVGDGIVLTKPLGGGILAFGRQLGRVTDGQMEEAARSMAALNRIAGDLMVKYGVHAATDVTGFSLLGHMAEIVRNSGRDGVEVELAFNAIPLFGGVAELAAGEVLPGATERNREAVGEEIVDLDGLTAGECGILFGPETSGGILAFLPAAQAEALVRELHEQGVRGARIIGRVVGEAAGGLIRAVKGGEPVGVEEAREAVREPASACCCTAAPLAPPPPPTAVSHVAAPAAGPQTGRLPAAGSGDAFRQYMAAVNAPGALSVREKKLIALALSIACKCEPCVKINGEAAREAGASEEALSEAAALGIAFGGASAAMLYQKARGA